MDNKSKTNQKIKYKIAIIAPTPHYYHVPLYRYIAESPEIDLTVYYCSDEAITGRFSGDNILNGYSYKFMKNYSLHPSYLYWPFGLINFGIWREIKNGKYDAVVLQAWTHLTWYIAFLACLTSKTPVLFMTDGNILSESSDTFKRIFKKIILQFLFKNATGFLTAGKANEQLYIHYGASHKKMMPMRFSWGYGYFLEEFYRLKPQREKIRSFFGIKKEEFVLLFVGRLAKEKRIFDLLDAYNKVDKDNKKLFFVGDGPLLDQAKKYVEDLNIKGVYFAGFQPRENLSNFYILADALVLPSYWEAWGMVVNEAMCFGLPVIASDKVGAVPDLVFNNQNGFIFPVGDIKCLSECIKKLFNMPMQESLSFGEKSNKIIKEWIKGTNPVWQIITLLKKLGIKK